MNEKFFEFFKDPSKYIKEMLRLSLDNKWYKDSHKTMFSPCPFCFDTNDRADLPIPDFDGCLACFCPPEICQDGGFGGMVDTLSESHPKTEHKTRVADLTEKELHGMLSLFKARLDNLDRD